MERILITGAAGQIGKALRQGLRGSDPLVRLLDFAPLGNRGRLGEGAAAQYRGLLQRLRGGPPQRREAE